jgi:hypothetical protein
MRLLLGLLKGAIIGGGLGYGAFALGLGGSWLWLIYGAIGAMVGFWVGRPIWAHLTDKQSTIWTSVLKAVFGFGVGVGLWALGAKAAGDPVIDLQFLSTTPRPLTAWQPVFGALVGALYGAWVEMDDPPGKRADKGAAKKA